MTANKEVLRKLAFHYVSADVAAAANMTVQQMKLFIQGSYQPSQQQLEALAKRIDSHMGERKKHGHRQQRRPSHCRRRRPRWG